MNIKIGSGPLTERGKVINYYRGLLGRVDGVWMSLLRCPFGDVRITQLFLVNFDDHVVALAENLSDLWSVDFLVEYELELLLGTDLVH